MSIFANISNSERVLLLGLLGLSAFSVFANVTLGLLLLYAIFIIYGYRHDGFNGAVVFTLLIVYFELVWVDGPGSLSELVITLTKLPEWVVRFVIPNLFLLVSAIVTPRKGMIESVIFGGSK